jgi:hypothetical protein
MTLRRTGTARGAVFYKGDDGKKYQLRQVNRAYEGRAKPPTYYLELVDGAGKAHYMSGLFPTKSTGVYSLDLKDEVTGCRLMFDACFSMGGELVELKPKGKERARV